MFNGLGIGINHISHPIKFSFFFVNVNDRNPKSKNAVKTECEAEIKSLKQELSKLKSDLATCQSQMEFGDEDFDPLL